MSATEREETARKRAVQEFREVVESREAKEESSIGLEQIEGHWDDMLGRISGPQGSPYEGGTFLLEIKVPKTYPFHPPKIHFITKVWHPNVSSLNGFIHLNILKDDWVPWLSLRTVMLSIQGLLSTPDHFQDTTTQDLFALTAQHWTNVYAGGANNVPEFDQYVHQLVELGIDESKARMCLSVSNWDMDKVTEQLDFS